MLNSFKGGAVLGIATALREVTFCFNRIPSTSLGQEETMTVRYRHLVSYDLPAESSLYGDSAYTNYEIEDMFKESEQVNLQIARKSNVKRKNISAVTFIKEYMRKRIETSISQICALMPRHINAVTADGFIIKISYS